MIEIVIDKVEWEVVNVKTLCKIVGSDATLFISIELMELIMPQGLLYLVSECKVIFTLNLLLTIENSHTHHFICGSEILFLPLKHIVLLSELGLFPMISQIVGHLLKGHFTPAFLKSDLMTLDGV